MGSRDQAQMPSDVACQSGSNKNALVTAAIAPAAGAVVSRQSRVNDLIVKTERKRLALGAKVIFVNGSEADWLNQGSPSLLPLPFSLAQLTSHCCLPCLLVRSHCHSALSWLNRYSLVRSAQTSVAGLGARPVKRDSFERQTTNVWLTGWAGWLGNTWISRGESESHDVPELSDSSFV